jgi:hypothetical protein
MNEYTLNKFRDAINTIVVLTHDNALKSGWWDGYDWSDVHKQNTKISLVASEVFEAQDALRTDSNDSHLPQHKGVYTELIDALIRVGDTLGRYMDDDKNLDPGQIAVDKMVYNAKRKDHKPEARAAKGGKRF